MPDGGLPGWTVPAAAAALDPADLARLAALAAAGRRPASPDAIVRTMQGMASPDWRPTMDVAEAALGGLLRDRAIAWYGPNAGLLALGPAGHMTAARLLRRPAGTGGPPPRAFAAVAFAALDLVRDPGTRAAVLRRLAVLAEDERVRRRQVRGVGAPGAHAAAWRDHELARAAGEVAWLAGEASRPTPPPATSRD